MLFVEVFLEFGKLVEVPVSLAQSVAGIAEFSRRGRAAAASTESGSAAAVTVVENTHVRPVTFRCHS